MIALSENYLNGTLETGTIAAKPYRGGALAKLTPEQMPLIESLIEEDNDATLEQLCRRVEEKTGVRVSVPTMCRMLQKLAFVGWTDKDAFLTYVKEVLVPQLWPGACVVMDNLSAHKTAEVKKAIESVGARVKFLSPYSPDFNSIENCWSKVKKFLRSCESRTYIELDQSITEAIDLVTEKDLIGWFTHCCYYR